MTPDPPASPAGSQPPAAGRAEQGGAVPWYARTGVLLGIGASVLAVSVIAAVAFWWGGRGPAGTAGGPEATAVPAVADASSYTASWVFKDPNRSVEGVAGSATPPQPAVWVLEESVVVASVDVVRAHDRSDGSVLWDVPAVGHVCAAVERLPVDSPVVVFGHGEECDRLTALDAATGEVRWERDKAWDDAEQLIMTPAGLVTVDSSAVQFLDPGTGDPRGGYSQRDLAALLGPDVGFARFDHAALSADGSVLVVAVPGTSDGDPPFAIGFDADTGEHLWAAALAGDADGAGLLVAQPQSRDGATIHLRQVREPYGKSVVVLDPATGEVRSRYPVPAATPPVGRADFDETGNLGGSAWYRSGPGFVDGDAVLVHDQLTWEPTDGTQTRQVQHLVRWDATTGEEVWRLKPEDVEPDLLESANVVHVVAGPLLGEGKMLVLAHNLSKGSLLVVDTATGEPSVTAALPAELAGSSLLNEPAIEVLDEGVLLAYNPEGGPNSVDRGGKAGGDDVAMVLLKPGR